jgi:uncharacterized protein
MTQTLNAPLANAGGPIRSSERIATLDIVRGFALLGILIMNMPGFSTSFYSEADGSHLWPDLLNQRAEQIRDMLFSGKFNSMFSLLFGLGFTIQLTRLTARDPDNAAKHYWRRLLVLAGFAAVHVLLMWGGDVLHIYAGLGVLLYFLRNASNRLILGLMVACLLYPAVSGILRIYVITPEITKQLVAQSKAWEASNIAAYGHGSFIDAAREHIRDFIHTYGQPLRLWGIFGFWVQMTLTMLIGLLIGKNNWVPRIPELMPKIRRLQWWALGLGIVCGVTFEVLAQMNRVPGPSPVKVVISVAYGLCRLSMMCFYVLTIVRLAQAPEWQKRFAPMAACGRMPLTNYLGQTLIATTIFYGWGFGFYGKMGPALGLVLAFAIYFVIQVPLSLWWLKRFEFGPLEYVWRTLTYGRRPGT